MRLFVFLSLLLAPLTASAQDHPAAGHWEGAIEIPGMQLGIKVDLSVDGGVWSGTIDIPAQSATGLPLEGVTVEGASIVFSIAGIPGEPTFTGTHAPGTISGQFTQSGQEFPFTLSRGIVAEPGRPQEPKPPFPYEERDVSYRNGDITLAGTLTLPKGDGPFAAALLITGSGPQDRNEEVFGHKPFWVLADDLTRNGVAALRVDDRGVGGTTGDVNEATSADFAGDVIAGVEYLKSQAEIDPGKIGVIGHSEGGIVGPLAATMTEDIAFVVMLAGPGVPGSEVLIEQSKLIGRAQGADEAGLATRIKRLGEFLELIATEPDVDRLREKADALIRAQLETMTEAELELLGDDPELALQQQADALLSPWFRYFFTYDPAPTLNQLRVPVLALFGENDLQVPRDQNVPAVTAALEGSGNADVTVTVLPGLNHLFQTSATGNPAEYYPIEETINEAALSAIREWILARFVLGETR